MRGSFVRTGCLAALLGAGWLAPLRLAAQSLTIPDLAVQTMATGLDQPTQVVFLDSDDLLVMEKASGLVRRFIDGAPAGTVLDLAVNFRNERGALGMALHPDFDSNGWVYVYYSESSTGLDNGTQFAVLGNRIYRFTWDGAALTLPTLLIDLAVQPGPNHDGGILLFGPDEKLYAVIGELNRNGQLANWPTGDLPDTTGVVVRLNDDGSSPSDNPFFGVPRMAPVYAYGIRNSYGMAFDPLTGNLWDSENGPTNYDEVNLIGPGTNSGWERIMGPDSRDPQGLGDLWMAAGAVYSDPEFSWFETIAPTSLVFFPDRYRPDLQGDLLLGDNNTGSLYRFELNATRDSLALSDASVTDLVADDAAERALNDVGSGWNIITDLEVGPDGWIYVVSLGDGAVYRIVDETTGTAAPGPAPAARPRVVSVAPNPANPRVEILLDLPEATEGLVEVVDVAGRRVRSLSRGALLAGRSTLVWDGADDAGRPVASGLYFVRLVAAAGSDGRKLVLVK